MSSSKDGSLKNKDEFERTWEAAREGDELDRLIFVCSAHLGMRASEIAALKKDWINFQSREVNIPKKDGSFKAKSEASARSIPYGRVRGRVRRELENYLDYHDEVQSNRKTIWYRVKRMREKAGLPRNIYPHSLRATATFQLAEAGFSAQALRQFMGWSQLNTAQSYISQAGRAAERELEVEGKNLW